jgi:hypothetical protein
MKRRTRRWEAVTAARLARSVIRGMCNRCLLALLVFALGFVGCTNDEATQPSASVGSTPPGGLECPGGTEDERTTIYDLGENPKGLATPRDALDRFLRGRNAEVTSEGFERRDGKAGLGNAVTFTYSRDGLKLAEIWVVHLEAGWLVEAYRHCEGEL